MAWTFEHSVECRAGREAAWQFWTAVENWAAVDSAVESVTINGPFAVGTTGTTVSPGFGAVEWRIVEVWDGARAVIEVPAPGAALRFTWRFEDAPGGGTRITQQATLVGEQADHYAAMLGPQYEQGAPQGMRKLAGAIDRAAAGGE
jgi:hypothetical protein